MTSKNSDNNESLHLGILEIITVMCVILIFCFCVVFVCYFYAYGQFRDSIVPPSYDKKNNTGGDTMTFRSSQDVTRQAKFKGRSGYTFWLILQKTFAAFSHRKIKVAQIWSTHQSKALIFYFGINKILSWIFENFVKNRQTKFHVLKFRVCVNTH